MTRRPAALATGLVALTMLMPASASAAGESVNWVEHLPPAGSPAAVQPGPVAHCKRARRGCIRVVVRRLREVRREFGCDHRAVFATTYLVLTQTFLEALRADPGLVRDRRYLFTEDALFANFYFQVLRADRRGADVPDAWRIALDTAGDGEVNAAQDMLLGINAHVQNDMPFVLAALGLTTPRGESRKPDHDASNAVLDRAYQRVVDEVERRYDPLLAVTNPDGTTADDSAGLELVRSWRERVWRNAERLAAARNAEEQRQVAREIEADAAAWARGIAAYEQAGERERRDAYCHRQNAPR